MLCFPHKHYRADKFWIVKLSFFIFVIILLPFDRNNFFLVKRSQYTGIENTLHKQSEKAFMRLVRTRDFTVVVTFMIFTIDFLYPYKPVCIKSLLGAPELLHQWSKEERRSVLSFTSREYNVLLWLQCSAVWRKTPSKTNQCYEPRNP